MMTMIMMMMMIYQEIFIWTYAWTFVSMVLKSSALGTEGNIYYRKNFETVVLGTEKNHVLK